jgi:hypothetical protein
MSKPFRFGPSKLDLPDQIPAGWLVPIPGMGPKPTPSANQTFIQGGRAISTAGELPPSAHSRGVARLNLSASPETNPMGYDGRIRQASGEVYSANFPEVDIQWGAIPRLDGQGNPRLGAQGQPLTRPGFYTPDNVTRPEYPDETLSAVMRTGFRTPYTARLPVEIPGDADIVNSAATMDLFRPAKPGNYDKMHFLVQNNAGQERPAMLYEDRMPDVIGNPDAIAMGRLKPVSLGRSVEDLYFRAINGGGQPTVQDIPNYLVSGRKSNLGDSRTIEHNPGAVWDDIGLPSYTVPSAANMVDISRSDSLQHLVSRPRTWIGTDLEPDKYTADGSVYAFPEDRLPTLFSGQSIDQQNEYKDAVYSVNIGGRRFKQRVNTPELGQTEDEARELYRNLQAQRHAKPGITPAQQLSQSPVYGAPPQWALPQTVTIDGATAQIPALTAQQQRAYNDRVRAQQEPYSLLNTQRALSIQDQDARAGNYIFGRRVQQNLADIGPASYTPIPTEKAVDYPILSVTNASNVPDDLSSRVLADINMDRKLEGVFAGSPSNRKPLEIPAGKIGLPAGTMIEVPSGIDPANVDSRVGTPKSSYLTPLLPNSIEDVDGIAQRALSWEIPDPRSAAFSGMDISNEGADIALQNLRQSAARLDAAAKSDRQRAAHLQQTAKLRSLSPAESAVVARSQRSDELANATRQRADLVDQRIQSAWDQVPVPPVNQVMSLGGDRPIPVTYQQQLAMERDARLAGKPIPGLVLPQGASVVTRGEYVDSNPFDTFTMLQGADPTVRPNQIRKGVQFEYNDDGKPVGVISAGVPLKDARGATQMWKPEQRLIIGGSDGDRAVPVLLPRASREQSRDQTLTQIRAAGGTSQGNEAFLTSDDIANIQAQGQLENINRQRVAIGRSPAKSIEQAELEAASRSDVLRQAAQKLVQAKAASLVEPEAGAIGAANAYRNAASPLVDRRLSGPDQAFVEATTLPRSDARRQVVMNARNPQYREQIETMVDDLEGVTPSRLRIDPRTLNLFYSGR